MPNDLIDVIAALPAAERAKLRAKNQRDLERARAEVARLEVQEQQFEMAETKVARGSSRPGRPGKLTAEIVLEAASKTPQPATATAITATLVESGVGVTVNAVRNHLNKLKEDGDLEKDDETGAFVLPKVFIPVEFPSSPADDDIPF